MSARVSATLVRQMCRLQPLLHSSLLTVKGVWFHRKRTPLRRCRWRSGTRFMLEPQDTFLQCACIPAHIQRTVRLLRVGRRPAVSDNSEWFSWCFIFFCPFSYFSYKNTEIFRQKVISLTLLKRTEHSLLKGPFPFYWDSRRVLFIQSQFGFF